MAALISYSRETFLLICYYGYSYEILENHCKQTLFLIKTAVNRNCSTYSSSTTIWSLSNYQSNFILSFTWKLMITQTVLEQFCFLIKRLPLPKNQEKQCIPDGYTNSLGMDLSATHTFMYLQDKLILYSNP